MFRFCHSHPHTSHPAHILNSYHPFQTFIEILPTDLCPNCPKWLEQRLTQSWNVRKGRHFSSPLLSSHLFTGWVRRQRPREAAGLAHASPNTLSLLPSSKSLYLLSTNIPYLLPNLWYLYCINALISRHHSHFNSNLVSQREKNHPFYLHSHHIQCLSDWGFSFFCCHKQQFKIHRGLA